MIRPPFANYPRDELERLVREGFENIERQAYAKTKHGFFEEPYAVIGHYKFQILVAADFYLRSTAKKS